MTLPIKMKIKEVSKLNYDDVDPGTRRIFVVFGIILNSFITFAGYYNLYWNTIISTISLIISTIIWFILSFFIIYEVDFYLESRKKKKIYNERLKAGKKTKSGYIEPKRERKKYRGIEYELAILESPSEDRWVVIESEFNSYSNLFLNLEKYFDFNLDDFLYVSNLNGETIDDQWKEGERVAKYQIDGFYELYENRETLLNEKITDIKNTVIKLEKIIENLRSE